MTEPAQAICNRRRSRFAQTARKPLADSPRVLSWPSSPSVRAYEGEPTRASGFLATAEPREEGGRLAPHHRVRLRRPRQPQLPLRRIHAAEPEQHEPEVEAHGGRLREPA